MLRSVTSQMRKNSTDHWFWCVWSFSCLGDLESHLSCLGAQLLLFYVPVGVFIEEFIFHVLGSVFMLCIIYFYVLKKAWITLKLVWNDCQVQKFSKLMFECVRSVLKLKSQNEFLIEPIIMVSCEKGVPRSFWSRSRLLGRLQNIQKDFNWFDILKMLENVKVEIVLQTCFSRSANIFTWIFHDPWVLFGFPIEKIRLCF